MRESGGHLFCERKFDNTDYLSKEAKRLRHEVELAKRENRHLNGEDLNAVQMPELDGLELKLEEALRKIRMRKREVMQMEIDRLQQKLNDAQTAAVVASQSSAGALMQAGGFTPLLRPELSSTNVCLPSAASLSQLGLGGSFPLSTSAMTFGLSTTNLPSPSGTQQPGLGQNHMMALSMPGPQKLPLPSRLPSVRSMQDSSVVSAHHVASGLGPIETNPQQWPSQTSFKMLMNPPSRFPSPQLNIPVSGSPSTPPGGGGPPQLTLPPSVTGQNQQPPTAPYNPGGEG
ncbi:MADS box protein [Chara braunii]|uniref:MADS box protein n=1 Tax=Chara braunii TaxID=69332 RepID=A0A388L9Y4_CHABU|nr:MADS box protein [Chara braunii]|eukprot:GBG79096.1 MADS box protein [Chara braunii]